MSILTRSAGITGSMPVITVDISLPQFSYRGTAARHGSQERVDGVTIREGEAPAEPPRDGQPTFHFGTAVPTLPLPLGEA